ncbi:MAG: glycosyltransferase family 39 protein [Synechococcus sp.]|nr:glycosyltransferase family 39 protein [Synechococcus sp.]
MALKGVEQRWLLVVLGISLGIGVLCRLLLLARLPPWTDEMATIVFSLGHNFHGVPFNEFVTGGELLQPLVRDEQANLLSVWQNLMADSTHPPLYFWLCHLWLGLFTAPQTMVSIGVARLLAVIFGLGSIAWVYGLANWVSGSRLAGICSATLMAISPFNIFLAREARHYTFVMIWVTLALFCLALGIQRLRQSKAIPFWLIALWVGVNSFGIATHYFFGLSIFSQGLVVLWNLIRNQASWRQYLPFCFVALGSLIGSLIWLPMVQAAHGSSPTQWIYGSLLFEPWLPLLWMLMWFISMLSMLPTAVTSGVSLWVTVLSAITLLGFSGWTFPKLFRTFPLQKDSPNSTLGQYLLVMLILFLFLSYSGIVNITVAPRFCFLWFPAFIVLAGIALAQVRQPQVIAIILTIGLVGSFTTMLDLGYLQHERIDLLATVIRQESKTPNPVITIPHKHHGQTGRLMGLAWVFSQQKQGNSILDPRFFLAERLNNNYDLSIKLLKQLIADSSEATELWLIMPNEDFKHTDWKKSGCSFQNKGIIGQLNYRLYDCLP